jgi:hypothetical protein
MDKKTRERFFEELVAIADDVLTRSKDVYVPVLTGALKDSGALKAHRGRYPVAYVSFGGPEVPYALIQHENLQFQHPRGGSAKYLELAVKDYEPQMADRLSVATRSEMKKHSMAGKAIKGGV